MRRRVFVAVNFDEKTIAEIKSLLDECRKKLPRGIERQIRFLPPENWHITLSFFGHQEEKDVEKIKKILKEMSGSSQDQWSCDDQVCRRSLAARLEKLIWAPRDKPPRMIWLSCDRETSQKLGAIKKQLEDLLEKDGVPFRRERREFNAHVTLARFDLRLPKDGRPRIEKTLNWRFQVEGLDLMESKLERGGTRYSIMDQFQLRRDRW